MDEKALEAAKLQLTSYGGIEKYLRDIINYCGSGYKDKPTDEIVFQTKKHLKDVSNSIAEYLLNISKNVNGFIDSQQRELVTITEDMKAITHRAKSAEEYMATLYSTKFCTYRRPVQSVRVLRKKLPNEQLPKWARAKHAWSPEEKFTFTELDKIGAITKPDGANQMTRQSEKRRIDKGSPHQYSTMSRTPPGTLPSMPNALPLVQGDQ